VLAKVEGPKVYLLEHESEKWVEDPWVTDDYQNQLDSLPTPIAQEKHEP